MFDELVTDLYEYIDILRYSPEIEITRGAIADELDIIIGRRFGSEKVKELHRKLCTCRRRMEQSKLE
jgi:hypothetical protein